MSKVIISSKIKIW